MSKLKQETVFNTRQKAKPLLSIRLGKVETPTSMIRRNRVHLTPLPNQQEQQERPTPIVNQVPSEGKAATPVLKDIPVTKGDILESL